MTLRKPGEVAAKFVIPEATLSQWRYRGIGPPYIKVGRHVRYRDEDVTDWLSAHTVVAGGPDAPAA